VSGLPDEDRLRIRELAERYCLAMDNALAEEWAATFAEDGVFEGVDGTYRGREELVAFARRHAADPRYNTGQHWVSNFAIEVEGDRAEVFSNFQLVAHEPGSDPVRYYVRSVGWYRDSLVRTAEGWRFARRKVVLEPARPGPVPGFRRA
jgi:3-phenylpropionate/cinnamic acid dioxygenase small subunit